ncbi:MAG: hypothetical protein IJU84_05440, partial [Clostridia bacterium]|nr:hypothetical protein [Clostridia bacterium]
DNPNPWGHTQLDVGENYRYMPAEVTCRITEKGEVLTALESIYSLGKSTVRIEYRVYKNFPYIDVKVNSTWNDEGKGLKLEIPVAAMEKFIGQTAYGTQVNRTETEESTHKYCAVKEGENYLAVLKTGCYGCSVEKGKLYINILNGSVYCAHPVNEFPVIDEKRFNRYVETGRHEHSFRLYVGNENSLDAAAEEFVNEPYALNVYPHGNGRKLIENPVALSDKEITLSVFRRGGKGYTIRLYNGAPAEKEVICRVGESELKLRFGKYEVKTLVYDNERLTERSEMIFINNE